MVLVANKFDPTVEELEIFKSHISFEEGMDESVLSFYLAFGKEYAFNATGKEMSRVAYLTAAMFWEFRIPEDQMASAFNAMTPLFIQQSVVDDDG